MKHNSAILFISNYSRQSQGGGIKTFVENLFDHLNASPRELYLVARYGRGKGDHEKIINGNVIVFILRAFVWCFKLKPAVIHTHATWYCILPALLYRAIRKVRVVHSIHSIPEKNYNRRVRFLFGLLLKRCDHVHFVSFFLREHYLHVLRLQCRESSVIYPGADHHDVHVSDEEKEEFLSAFSICKGAFIIAAQGLTSHRLKYQGASLLLDVFKKLSVQFGNLVLVLTKNGKYVDALRQKAHHLQIEDSVVFTGDVNNPRVVNSVTDVYAHITLAEGGVSLALLEAMAAGRAIVATKAGGIPELLNGSNTALMVMPEAAHVYAAMKRLIADETLRKTIGSNARNYVKERFFWKNTADNFLKLYNSLT